MQRDLLMISKFLIIFLYMSSFKDHSGLSLTFLDSASAVLFCLDDIDEAYAHNFLFLQNSQNILFILKIS